MTDVQISYPKGRPEMRVDGKALAPDSRVTLPVDHLLALVDATALYLARTLTEQKLKPVRAGLQKLEAAIRQHAADDVAAVQQRSQTPRRSEHVRQVVRDPATNLITHLIDLE